MATKSLGASFRELVDRSHNNNLHTKLEGYHKSITTINDFPHLIVHGSSGVGKYTQVLRILEHLSARDLNYQKISVVTIGKDKEYRMKLSDIHCEVDCTMLAINPRSLWNEIFFHIMDIVQSKKQKEMVILCKHFQTVNQELLDIFYYYMTYYNPYVEIRFVLVTTEISFIPEHIRSLCDVISVERPTKKKIEAISNKRLPATNPTHSISNMEHVIQGNLELSNPHHLICNEILDQIYDVDNLSIAKLRDTIYKLLIFHQDIYNSMNYIIQQCIIRGSINDIKFTELYHHIHKLSVLYNNNYRPIFHLERFILYLCKVINE